MIFIEALMKASLTVVVWVTKNKILRTLAKLSFVFTTAPRFEPNSAFRYRIERFLWCKEYFRQAWYCFDSRFRVVVRIQIFWHMIGLPKKLVDSLKRTNLWHGCVPSLFHYMVGGYNWRLSSGRSDRQVKRHSCCILKNVIVIVTVYECNNARKVKRSGNNMLIYARHIC